ncbi:conserved hypothetical protein [Chthoniobacter flavus Ellin428]|uniref:N-acetyltransferase domain-containing protein n=1 Tax=Chthoniobacter flavus Ellin428 TaxID=497964 RepID=B4CZU4_9BACT|nr:hypothetical protein [Chthoniobacter flavus]EDY20258.1 conserved hypothetical protein [Chthoniobacter flavus Ellin428]TCO94155.1 hypothetical protein EV701_103244 [Chthoniobacter flavus]
MSLRIVPYQVEHEPAVAEFNARGQAHEAPFGLSKTALSAWLPKQEGRIVVRELFLALEGAEVRGGFALRRQPFWLRGAVRDICNYQGPISEGIWDRRYMMSGVQMLRAALRECPLLYALGMGGVEQPLPKLLAAAGWSMKPIPFRFYVLRPSRFLREIRPLRRTKLRAAILDVAALSGLGSLALWARQAYRTRHRLPNGSRAERVDRYEAWADTIWMKARDAYALTAVRDQAAQNVLFGDGNVKNMTLRCQRNGQDIGWAVVRSTVMQDDKYFGNLRLGSLVDCLSIPGEEANIVALATDYLRELGSDLVVTNQSHTAWLNALSARGYMEGPSNFLFACSPQLAQELGPLSGALGTVHCNRADGDGPIHL